MHSKNNLQYALFPVLFLQTLFHLLVLMYMYMSMYRLTGQRSCSGCGFPGTHYATELQCEKGGKEGGRVKRGEGVRREGVRREGVRREGCEEGRV